MRIQNPVSVAAREIRIGDLLLNAGNTVRVVDVKRVAGLNGAVFYELRTHPIGRPRVDTVEDMLYLFEADRKLLRVASAVELYVFRGAPAC
jgi:hypothetical protein